MALRNPHLDYAAELQRLRHTYATAPPQARLNTIVQRLRRPDAGAAQLVTAVSAVEGLARSLAVHAGAKTDTASRYAVYKKREAHSLIEEVLRLYRQPPPSAFFRQDTWPLFKSAVNFRNLIVHECTYLGQDKYPSLLQATDEVLTALVKLGRLRAGRT